MNYTFVANTPSDVTLEPGSLITAADLPARDYAIYLQADLNTFLATDIDETTQITIPNRPVTDENGSVEDLTQDILAGTDASVFHNKLHKVFKTTWAGLLVSDSAGVQGGTSDLEFGDVVRLIIRNLLDPQENTNLLDPDDNIVTDDGERFNIDRTKIDTWLQYQDENSEGDFATQVFNLIQVDSILRQVRDLQQFHIDTGQFHLSEGSRIGVVVNLKTHSGNVMVVHLYIVQTAVADPVDWDGSGAFVSVNLNHTNITLQTNMYPGWVPNGGLLSEGGAYSLLPGEIVPHDIIVLARNPPNVLSNPHPVVVHQPGSGDMGYLGRPHELILPNRHWVTDRQPREIIGLAPRPSEAWDVEAFGAGPNYSGYFLINVHHIALNPSLSTYPRSDGTPLNLYTDYFYGHTQSRDGVGEYHLHMARFSVDFNYANKIIGYASTGHPIMGQGTAIYEPIMTGNHTTGHGTIQRPSKSGYNLRSDFVNHRQTFEITAPTDNPGIFHLDFEYNPSVSSTSWNLDEYNMGWVKIAGQFRKAYVLTLDYPYSVHTLYQQQ